MTRLPALAVALAVVVSGCSTGGDGGSGAAGDRSTTTTTTPEEVVPGDDWAVGDPEDHGVDPAGLEEARRYAFAEGKNTQGVVVVKDGVIVAEWYADGADEDSWAASWSMAKSVTGATVGIAIEEGHLGGVEDPVADHVASWRGTDRAAITVRDLLQMSSGLDWSEDYLGSIEESEVNRMVTTGTDHLAIARERPLAHEPGTHWSYSSGDSMLLSGVVESATGRTLGEYATEVLLDPIGIEPVDWWRDLAGHTLGYCCLDMSTRDFARIGLLFGRGGRWGDEQVVPERYVADSLEPAADSDGEYGYQWWLTDMDGVPEDAFIASGHDSQNIFVVPSLDLVVVRNGTYHKDPGPPVADPTLFSRYPSDARVPGRGTVPPDEWDDATFLAPIVAAVEEG